MSIRSYSELYLEHVSRNLGLIFEYAIRYGYEPDIFWNIFIVSNIAKEIENGNPKYLVGMSAIDLFDEIINSDKSNKKFIPKPFVDLTKYYWAGWILAYYQHYRNLSFLKINKALPISRVLQLYQSLHEADITKFILIADEFILDTITESNLKQIRLAAGLSQSQLANKSAVSIRNIQMYEQHQNDINKAQGDILYRLAKTLGCKIEDLFEQNIL